jgi:hypothetical protein
MKSLNTNLTIKTEKLTLTLLILSLAFGCKKTEDKTIPELTTAIVTEITSISATAGGEVSFDGGADVTARGVCWSTEPDPTINNSKTEDGYGVGSFISNMTGLVPNNTYYIRAYATNSAGTGYGNTVTFTTTEAITLPELTTNGIIIITSTTAMTGGKITSDGGATVTARGVVWSENQNPTLESSHGMVSEEEDPEEFSCLITGLTPETTYFVRTYATNEAGTAYGDQQSFTTAPPLSWGVTNFTRDDGLIGNSVTSIAVDNSNNIWVGTNSGLSKFDGSSWTSYTAADGLADDAIRALSFDPDGNLWIGTYEDGISKFDGQTWTTYTEDDGLFNNRVYSIHADNSSNIWIGTGNNHITKFDGTGFDFFAVNPQTNPEGTIMGHIHAIYADHDDNLWVGSCYTGLSMYDGNNWTHYINNLNSFINTIYCSSIGEVWFGQSPLGAFRYSEGSWENFPPESGTGLEFVYTINEDAEGNIWIGGRNGVSVFQGSNWEVISSYDGLINEVVSSLAGDNNGNMWAGGANGLSRFFKLQD